MSTPTNPTVDDPFLYAPRPKSTVQPETKDGTRPSIHVSLYAYGGISAACLMSWVDLTATFCLLYTSPSPRDRG